MNLLIVGLVCGAALCGIGAVAVSGCGAGSSASANPLDASVETPDARLAGEDVTVDDAGVTLCGAGKKSCAGRCVDETPDNGCDDPSCAPCLVAHGTLVPDAGCAPSCRAVCDPGYVPCGAHDCCLPGPRHPVVTLIAGDSFTCAGSAGSFGEPACFGLGTGGQLGDGTFASSSTPKVLTLNLHWVPPWPATAGKAHVCFLSTDLGPPSYCWGDDAHGQLGFDGGASAFPINGNLGPGHALGAGTAHTCILDGNGALTCVGANEHGQLGDGTTSDGWATPFASPSTVAGVAAGYATSCAVLADATFECWGDDSAGQYGDGTQSSLPKPTPAGSGLKVKTLAIGEAFACGITTSGGVKCWGDDTYGQLGNGAAPASLTPVDVVGLSANIAKVTVGRRHACALDTAGRVTCWGWNPLGQVGSGAPSSGVTSPAEVLASGASDIATGAQHSCAALAIGGAVCWGDNGDGELGDGTTTSSATPVAVVGW